MQIKMNYLKFTLLILLFSLCVFVSAKGRQRPGGNKDDKKKGRLPRTSLQAITTCMGQPIDLKTQVESLVQQCLESRIQEIQEHVDTNENGKPAKKERKKEKFVKKLRKKCLPECEWKTFEMNVPDLNETTTYPSAGIPESFLKKFPQNAQERIKARMELCYNNTSPLLPKEGRNKGLREKMCITNTRLFKCLNRAVRMTCKIRAAALTPLSGNGTAAPKSSSESNAVTTSSGQTAADDIDDEIDEGDDDKDDADDENDDEEESSTGTSSKKGMSPTTSVDTSKVITK